VKVVLSRHVLVEKIPLIKSLGFVISESQIEIIVKKPKWRGVTDSGQPTAMGLINGEHILRAVLKIKNGIITVITVHIARRGRYESTKED